VIECIFMNKKVLFCDSYIIVKLFLKAFYFCNNLTSIVPVRVATINYYNNLYRGGLKALTTVLEPRSRLIMTFTDAVGQPPRLIF